MSNLFCIEWHWLVWTHHQVYFSYGRHIHGSCIVLCICADLFVFYNVNSFSQFFALLGVNTYFSMCLPFMNCYNNCFCVFTQSSYNELTYKNILLFVQCGGYIYRKNCSTVCQPFRDISFLFKITKSR